MLRHATVLCVIPRRFKTVYSLVSNQKLYLQSHFVPCAQISSTNFGFSSSRKMGDTQSSQSGTESVSTNRPGKIKLSEEEWKQKLTPEEYKVTRKHGTEPAWSGALLENKDKGLYMCTCCGAELFSSNTKFDSGSGWPSFTKALSDKDTQDMPAVDTIRDSSMGMVRTEVRCGKTSTPMTLIKATVDERLQTSLLPHLPSDFHANDSDKGNSRRKASDISSLTKCDAHLGHVFNDGPSSTGLRYCINSVCLKFKPENPDKKGNQQ